jgi:hypothetical protein
MEQIAEKQRGSATLFADTFDKIAEAIVCEIAHAMRRRVEVHAIDDTVQ